VEAIRLIETNEEDTEHERTRNNQNNCNKGRHKLICVEHPRKIKANLNGLHGSVRERYRKRELLTGLANSYYWLSTFFFSICYLTEICRNLP
jgi:hypothetical protein